MTDPAAAPPQRRGFRSAWAGRWKTLVALGAVLVATAFDWNWPWGIIFIYWAVEGIRDRQTYLVEDIARETNPGLFWIIVCMWLASGGYLFFVDAQR